MKINHKVLMYLTAAAFLLSGCAKNGSKSEPVPVIKPAVSQEAEISGTYKGYISGISNNEIIIDTLEWLSDKDARTTYIKDKEAGLPVPAGFENDLYLRNISQDSIKVLLGGNTEIIMQTFSHDPSTGNYNFNEKISANQFINYIHKNFDRYKTTPFTFRITKGKADIVKEIYLP